MMVKPLVTVITITYNLIEANRRETFLQCVESVKNQTYDNIEYIIIDGASTDGTIELIESAGVTYYSEPDKGIYDAMNKGIDKAHGKYIAFLNSDDLWHDNRAVEYAVEVFQTTGCDFCGGNTRFIDENKPEANHIRYANLTQVFTRMPFCHQAMFCKTSVMRDEGNYDLQYKSASDYDFILKLFFKKYKAAVIPLTFATFRMGGESFENYELSWNECKKIAHKYYDEYYILDEKEEELFIKEAVLPDKLIKSLDVLLNEKQDWNAPRVSVITVCYNLIKHGRVESFERCMESVNKQIYKNIEHIIIDGGSDDGTLELVQKYSKKGWVTYISESDNGIYDAMSKGVRLSTGDILYFLNTDDYLCDNSIVEQIVDLFEQTNVDAIFGNIIPYLIDNEAQYVPVFQLNEPAKWEDIKKADDILLKRNIHHQTIFYKKYVFNTASFFSNEIPTGSDWLLHCNAFIRDRYSLQYYDINVAYFNMGGVSTNSENSPIEEYMNLHQQLYTKYCEYLTITDEDNNNIQLHNSDVWEVTKTKLFNKTIFVEKKKEGIKKKYLLNFIPFIKAVNNGRKKTYYLFHKIPIFNRYI